MSFLRCFIVSFFLVFGSNLVRAQDGSVSGAGGSISWVYGASGLVVTYSCTKGTQVGGGSGSDYGVAICAASGPDDVYNDLSPRSAIWGFDSATNQYYGLPLSGTTTLQLTVGNWYIARVSSRPAGATRSTTDAQKTFQVGAPPQKKLKIVIVNQDDRQWTFSLAGRNVVVDANSTGSSEYLDTDLASDAKSDAALAVLTSFQTYKERFHPLPGTPFYTDANGALISTEDPNLEFLTNRPVKLVEGPFTKDSAQVPENLVTVTIPANSAADGVTPTMVDQNPQPNNPPGQPQPSPSTNPADNASVTQTQVSSVNPDGTQKKPVVLQQTYATDDSNASVDAKSIDATLREIQSRNELLWQGREVAEDQRTGKITDAIKNSGLGNTNTGPGYDPNGSMTSAESAGQSAPKYAGDSPSAGSGVPDLPGGDPGVLWSGTVGDRTVSLSFATHGGYTAADGVLVAGKVILIWAAAIGFFYSCQGVLATFLTSLGIVPQVDVANGTENVLPGVALAKSLVSAGAVVTIIVASAAAIVALLGTFAQVTGSLSIASMMSAPSFGGLGYGVAILSRYVPVGTICAFAVMRAAFPFLVAPVYFGAVTAIKFAHI